jgi:hypothetical protein
VVNNRATQARGGGIYFTAGETATNAKQALNLYVYNSLIWGNTAMNANSGPNIYGERTSSYLTVAGTPLGNGLIVRSSLIENAGTAADINGTFGYLSPGSDTSREEDLFPGVTLRISRTNATVAEVPIPYDLKFLSGLYGDAAFWAAKTAGDIFADYAGKNYRLTSGSLARNRGNTGDEYYPDNPGDFATKHGFTFTQEIIDFLTPGWNTDLDGKPRFNGAIDIGAYEWRPQQ